MKRLVVMVLSRVPVFLLVLGEALVMYAATLVAKQAFTQLDPLYAVWYRVGFCALLMLLWRRPWLASKRNRLPRGRAAWAVVVGCGLSLALMNTMYYVAISNMNVGVATAIEFIGPLSVAVIAGRSWRERVGIVVAAAGVLTLAGMSLAQPSGGTFLVGLIAILIGGSMWGVYIVLGRRVAAGGTPLDWLSLSMLIGWAVQSLFLAVPAVRETVHPKAEATWAAQPGGGWLLVGLLLVVAVCASFLPYIVDQFIMRRTTSGAFSVMQSVNPAVASMIGLVFGEIPTVWDIVGILLVIFAVIITFSGDSNPA
ncbi:EamA family transporter [Bifidobacterium avesanii]|uniref:EamA family transporter n=1 Tax=Bifidobacterium avesanii TaxID=1798157 RepID=A0A7K3TJA3_9BIFI|nr:EamA family transporter [Bifidobacterium avesanii]KAB8288918.1 threonine transporter RhtB [Bifidobacterium avesanii]NEG79195.1 EamA family transporter [Bifidobacterium avesanii]